MSATRITALASHLACVEALCRDFVASLKGTPHYAAAVGIMALVTEGREMCKGDTAPIVAAPAPAPAPAPKAAPVVPAAPDSYRGVMRLGADGVTALAAARGVPLPPDGTFTARCGALWAALSATVAPAPAAPKPAPAPIPAPAAARNTPAPAAPKPAPAPVAPALPAVGSTVGYTTAKGKALTCRVSGHRLTLAASNGWTFSVPLDKVPGAKPGDTAVPYTSAKGKADTYRAVGYAVDITDTAKDNAAPFTVPVDRVTVAGAPTAPRPRPSPPRPRPPAASPWTAWPNRWASIRRATMCPSSPRLTPH
jgi:hypothetical protein